METTIEQLGKSCRSLSDQGERLNRGEAQLFHASLVTGNTAQCEKLIQTLKNRLKCKTQATKD